MKLLAPAARSRRVLLVFSAAIVRAQSVAPEKATESSKTLEQNFFAAIRTGERQGPLLYSGAGVNVGSDAQHLSRKEVEEQFQSHRGLYCRLFDSSCIDATIDLGNSSAHLLGPRNADPF